MVGTVKEGNEKHFFQKHLILRHLREIFIYFKERNPTFEICLAVSLRMHFGW